MRSLIPYRQIVRNGDQTGNERVFSIVPESQPADGEDGAADAKREKAGDSESSQRPYDGQIANHSRCEIKARPPQRELPVQRRQNKSRPGSIDQ